MKNKKENVIKDNFGNDVVLTSEEVEFVENLMDQCDDIELSYYPLDGSQDHIDHHIYGKLRAVVAEYEEFLSEKYGTVIQLV